MSNFIQLNLLKDNGEHGSVFHVNINHIVWFEDKLIKIIEDKPINIVQTSKEIYELINYKCKDKT
jgi:hypothetical protein